MRISIVNFQKGMAEPINRVAYQGERVVLERRGKGVAALVSMQDLQTLEALEDAADIKAALKARSEKGGIPLEDIKVELGFARPKSARRSA